jgi:hypothetical protein
MSTDSHSAARPFGDLPRHADVSFEKRDVKIRTIYWYLFALGISVVLSLIFCVYLYRFLDRLVAQWQPPAMPAREAALKHMSPSERDSLMYPPEPRLQGVPGHDTDPQTDLREKLREDNEANERLGWVDRNAGIAQIPVSEAMKIIAEKGLPGAAAPAEKK